MSILRYTVPNSFTALSLLLGVASIVTTQLGDLELAAWIIVWCGLLDVLDGVSARLLKATSNFGAEFDSMADLVAFGVAPAVLVLNAGLQIAGIEYGSNSFWLLLVAVAVFVLAGAMRLARFNLISEEISKGWFAGIPITASGGGLLSSIVLVLIHHEDIAFSLPLHLYFPVIMFVLAILMVSSIRFPKATRRENNFINVFQAVAIFGIYYCGITRTYPEYLLGMGLFLMIAGIIAGRITRGR
ncbi:MAG: CDP-diacylglycerol--serine O-phosphatidyltransferase [Gammaproteobacteria bacterium]|jgi:CDP-diacylglycerol--serine O-phosphatidyltransferase|nr:CDP-diacylglycerol--serine O-phosphatidyltransferase [Gammaproteobacteria bacterium]